MRKASHKPRISHHPTVAELQDAEEPFLKASGASPYRQTKQQAQMLNIVQDSVVALDPQLRITYWNNATERLLGWNADEVMGQDARRLLFSETAKLFAEALRCVQRRGTWHGEVLYRAKNGTERIVNSRWVGIREKRSASQAGQAVHSETRNGIASLIIVSTDITEHKRLTADLDHAARLAIVGKLAADLGHEIKNPLAGIKGVADAFLEHRHLTNREREWMEGVRREVARIDTRVRALLDLAQPHTFNVKESSLAEVVSVAVLLARRHAAAVMQAKGDKIGVEFVDTVGEPLLMLMDPEQIEEAILNLVLNAIESIKGSGRVTIRLRRQHSQKGSTKRNSNSEALIEVIDTGTGICVENRERIFDPFFTTKPDGTGLGLPLVRSTAEAHRGRITFKTKVGYGSVFVLALPLQPHR